MEVNDPRHLIGCGLTWEAGIETHRDFPCNPVVAAVPVAPEVVNSTELGVDNSTVSPVRLVSQSIESVRLLDGFLKFVVVLFIFSSDI